LQNPLFANVGDDRLKVTKFWGVQPSIPLETINQHLRKKTRWIRGFLPSSDEN
jgi:hypothetical protein